MTTLAYLQVGLPVADLPDGIPEAVVVYEEVEQHDGCEQYCGEVDCHEAGQWRSPRGRGTTVVVEGVRYVLSTRGESQWVKNVRANPNVTLTINGESTAYTATEVPVGERAPIIAAFEPQFGKLIVGRYFVKLPDAADHPAFALVPRSV